MANRYLDFMLEDTSDRKIIFRFNASQSSLHLFDGALTKDPTKRDFRDVYKIYYSWHILVSENEWDFAFDKNGEFVKENAEFLKENNWEPYRDVFDFYLDERSMLSSIGEITKTVLRNKKSETNILTFGEPGSDWHIIYHKGFTYEDYIENEKENVGDAYQPDTTEEEFNESIMYRPDMVEYNVFNNVNNKGFRFSLTKTKALEFAEYINEINHYWTVKSFRVPQAARFPEEPPFSS